MTTSSRTTAVLGAAGLVLTALPVAPAGARATASTIRALGGVHSIVFVAGSGQANALRGAVLPLTNDGEFEYHNYRFSDRYPITAGNDCSYPDPANHKVVDCRLPEVGDFYPQFDISLGDRDDSIAFGANVGQDSHLDLGPGDDVVASGVTFVDIEGGDGNDRITGGGIVHGGPGNDRLIGTNGTFRAFGGKGDDRIDGGPNADTIYGNSGNDTVRAGKGDDTVSGGPGNDVLYGNSGNDALVGGPGRDRITGGPGRDRIRP